VPFIVEGGSIHRCGRVPFFKGGWEPFVDKGGRMPFFKKTPLEGAVCQGREPFVKRGMFVERGSHLSMREGAIC